MIDTVMAAMLACAEDELTPPVGRVLVAPGAAVAFDDCCDGQLWVRLASMVPAGATTATGAVLQPCGVLSWLATVEIGVLRCAAVVDDNGQAPPAATLTTEALQEHADMKALDRAIRCCPTLNGMRRSVQRWDPLGPEGGCVGGMWTVTFLVDACGCG